MQIIFKSPWSVGLSTHLAKKHKRKLTDFESSIYGDKMKKTKVVQTGDESTGEVVTGDDGVSVAMIRVTEIEDRRRHNRGTSNRKSYRLLHLIFYHRVCDYVNSYQLNILAARK